MLVLKIKRQKSKRHKKCNIKRKLKFENYKKCLKATQLEIKLNYLEKKKIDIDSIKENYKEFIKSNKTILKTLQKFKSEKHVFIEEINKIALSSNDGKRMQLIYSIAYANRMSKDLVSAKKRLNVTIQ